MKREILKKFDEHGLNYGYDWIDETLDSVIAVITEIAKEHHQADLKKIQLRSFKDFLQSEYNLSVSNRMVDEYIKQC